MSLHSHTSIATEPADAGTGRRATVRTSVPRPVDRPAEPELVTLRNNSDPSPNWQEECTPLRVPRAYVKDCRKASLALSFKEHVAVGSLLCGSWSCPHCRKIESARLLNRLRRGMESRPDVNRILVTLTIDPHKFGAIPMGKKYWDAQGNETTSSKAQRSSTLWSGPTPLTFQEAAEQMSDEWNMLNDRLRRKAARAKVERVGYFRVIELHRNGWPHYHVVIEHPSWKAEDILPQVRGWSLGSQVEAVDLSLDDAVGEVAPYLTSAEKKGDGSKAYQFAASALPEGFRLYSTSKDFLAPAEAPEEVAERGLPLKGRPVEHAKPLRSYGAKTVMLLPDPKREAPPGYRPRSLIAWGDGARLWMLSRLDEANLLPTVFVDEADLPY